MPEYNKINVIIGGHAIMCESVSIEQASVHSPIHVLNNFGNIDTTPNPSKTTVSLKYFPEISNEIHLSMISGWKVNPTGNLRHLINIADAYIAGYLSSYSLDILPNQLCRAEATYNCFSVLGGPLFNQYYTDYNLYNLTQNSGLTHYWNTKFLQNNSIIDSSILQLSYNFDVSHKTNYIIGSADAAQISVISAIESLNILSESQNTPTFSVTEDFTNDLFGIDAVRLSGFAGNNFIDIPLTGFISQTTSTNPSNNQLILFNSTFNKYY